MPYSNVKSKDATEVRAPARGDVPRETQPAIPSTSTARRRLALLVDGDPVSVRLCRETLERMEFVIERVDSGVAAVVAARGRAPDLILMDFQLRDVTAGETIGWLRSNQALTSVPIIVLGIADGSRLPVKDPRAMVAIGKPLSPAAIERAVRHLCG
ncbi:MAG TPA: response regulator [Stellaceae bacterium]|nr:response regulator [Stellaceae bacterium]